MWFAPYTIKEFFSEYIGLILLFVLMLSMVCWVTYHEMNKENNKEEECLNMGKYRKKPIVIEAVQWFGDGDHPDVTMIPLDRFRDRLDAKDRRCKRCDLVLDGIHGEIKTLEGVHIVCPGDFIITGVAGEKYPCKPDIFEQTYEKVICLTDVKQ